MKKVITCKLCGKRVLGNQNQKYCSEECRIIMTKKRKKEEYAQYQAQGRQCVVCGKTFYPRHLGKKTCSDECAMALAVELRTSQISRPKIGDTVPCAYCGKPFVVKSATAKYCSTECYRKNMRETKKAQYRYRATEKKKEEPEKPWTLDRVVKEMTRRGMQYGEFVAQMREGLL